MAISSRTILTLFLLSLIVTCEAGIIEDLLGILFGIGSGKRSLSEVITTYLDSLFPKDDVDSDMMKEIYMLYSDDNDVRFSSNFVGLEENV